MINFQLASSEMYSTAFRELGIFDFQSACDYIMQLPYGRNTHRDDFLLVLQEGKGTCSSKHALLAFLADENGQDDIELMLGLFQMSAETHPELEHYFAELPFPYLPEAHCYLRYKGQLYDYTSSKQDIRIIEPFIVREQRMEPQQVVEWKPKIHQEYLKGWLKRNPNITFTVDEIWSFREQMIAAL